MNYLNELKNIKELTFKKQNIFYLLITVTIFAADRISKISVFNNFSEDVYFVNNFINLDLIWNIGIGFGFFSTNEPMLYNLITLLITAVLVLLFYFFIKSEFFDKLIYSTIIGGALGNYYDRLIYKAVPDFIDLHFNNFHWFTFNVADIFITLGIMFFIVKNFFVKN